MRFLGEKFWEKKSREFFTGNDGSADDDEEDLIRKTHDAKLKWIFFERKNMKDKIK